MGLGYMLVLSLNKKIIIIYDVAQTVYDEMTTAVKNNIHVIRTKLMGAGYVDEECIVLSSCGLKTFCLDYFVALLLSPT